MIRSILFSCMILLAGEFAFGDEYWISYDGNDYPENVGWRHMSSGENEAERRLEDGALVIDGRGPFPYDINDWYLMEMNGTLDPGPDEIFILRWRLLVEEVINLPDPGVTLFSDRKWAAAFEFTEDTIQSVFEKQVSARFTPGVFHRYELRSTDMSEYTLYIDDQLAIRGKFWSSASQSRVLWGDAVRGAASLSRWDYVEFGVIPEPSSALFLVGCAALWNSSRRLQCSRLHRRCNVSEGDLS